MAQAAAARRHGRIDAMSGRCRDGQPPCPVSVKFVDAQQKIGCLLVAYIASSQLGRLWAACVAYH